MSLVGEDLRKFRAKIMKSKSLNQLKDLLKRITPPKGVCRKKQGDSLKPVDKGDELFDCEAQKIELVDVNEELSNDGIPEKQIIIESTTSLARSNNMGILINSRTNFNHRSSLSHNVKTRS